MPYLLRGALVEYGSDFLGPIPNSVIFQFNPESLRRNIQVPSRSTGSAGRETSQVGEVPVESINLTAHFSAADRLKENDVITRSFGIGPQLAALEKMVQPTGGISGLIGEALDSAGDLLHGLGGDCPCQPIPREQYPRLLFVWGTNRVLPVIISSMNITEQHYDNLLNPIQAEVALGLQVLTADPCADDPIAEGARQYSMLAKDVQAAANLAATAEQLTDIIPF